MKLNVNGKDYEIKNIPGSLLLWVLRDELGLIGTKIGCGAGICGSCTVHVEGAATRSCITPIAQVEGRRITTIESLAEPQADGTLKLHPVQQAWLDEQVPQCSWCQSGQMMMAVRYAGTRRGRLLKPTGCQLCLGAMGVGGVNQQIEIAHRPQPGLGIDPLGERGPFEQDYRDPSSAVGRQDIPQCLIPGMVRMTLAEDDRMQVAGNRFRQCHRGLLEMVPEEGRHSFGLGATNQAIPAGDGLNGGAQRRLLGWMRVGTGAEPKEGVIGM